MYKVDFITGNNDLKVVNAARVSFAKHKEEFDDKDQRLLNYLAKHRHWTPFAHSRITLTSHGTMFNLDELSHTERAGLMTNVGVTKVRHSIWGWNEITKNPSVDENLRREIAYHLMAFFPKSAKALEIQDVDYLGLTTVVDDETEDDPRFIDFTLREEVPIFIARQRFKHSTGFVYNEVSRRYVSDTPTFFTPPVWRKKPEGSVKQGSSDEPAMTSKWMNYETHLDDSLELYRHAVEDVEIAPEQARMVLPQSMMTSYYVTGSLLDWQRAYDERIHPSAQKEIQKLAKKWKEVIPEIR